jgi:ribonuclease HI
MEVTAVIEALDYLFGLEELPHAITVVSDSTYVIKCFQDRWHAGWLRRGWKNSQGQPVANRDLWELLFALALAPKVPITWQWVKGHSGDQWNDVVDQLALTAATTQQATSGSK